jgi:hypothetical protein
MATADERLASILLKTERAKKHLADLQVEISAFLNANPYEVRGERNPQTGQPCYYLASVRDAPVSIAVVAGDAIQNLRSALDHLAWNMMEVGEPDLPVPLTEKERRGISFPITDTDDATKYEALRKGKVKGMRNDAVRVIDGFKPYKGGNDALWILNQLNNIDKHRLLITVGMSLGAISAATVLPKGMIHIYPAAQGGFTSRYYGPNEITLIPQNFTFPLKEGDILFTDHPDTEVNQDMKFRFDVAFNEVGIVEGKPILPTLVEIADYVEYIITSMKNKLV